MVAKPAPHQDANEEHPGNLRMINEESGDVMGFLDPVLVASVCHRLTCLRNDFDGAAIFQELRADSNHLLTDLHSSDSNRAFAGHAQLNFAQTCCPVATAIL